MQTFVTPALNNTDVTVFFTLFAKFPAIIDIMSELLPGGLCPPASQKILSPFALPKQITHKYVYLLQPLRKHQVKIIMS